MRSKQLTVFIILY